MNKSHIVMMKRALCKERLRRFSLAMNCANASA